MSITPVTPTTNDVENILNRWEKQDKAFLNGRTVRHIPEPSFLKTWEIVICAITIIGLFVLLGIYWKRKNDWAAIQAEKAVQERQAIEFQEVANETAAAIAQNAPATPAIIAPVKPDLQLQAKKMEVLARNPKWINTVNTWKGLSLSEEVWILQICELRRLGVTINAFKVILQGEQVPNAQQAKDCITVKDVVDHLELSKITSFSSKDKMDRVPDAIYLMKNLEELYLNSCGLVEAPDVSKFPNLKYLRLGINDLTKPPDVTKNIKLVELSLHTNHITSPPDVSQNSSLEILQLSNNLLKNAPNVINNPWLVVLDLSHNPLKSSLPDLRNNGRLRELNLEETEITKCPDLSNNLALEKVNLRDNRISYMAPPEDLLNLVEFDISQNIISYGAGQRFGSWKISRPHINFSMETTKK